MVNRADDGGGGSGGGFTIGKFVYACAIPYTILNDVLYSLHPKLRVNYSFSGFSKLRGHSFSGHNQRTKNSQQETNFVLTLVVMKLGHSKKI